MGEGFRYNIQHMGDIFVDSLERTVDSLKSSFRGVSLTYDIHELKKKKGKIHRKIGKRTSEVRKRSPEMELFADNEMVKLFSKLEGVDERIETCIQEREARLYPAADAI
ncbi:MAG TPA: hypothetical protein HPQ03_05510 [Deltaproteobacteria bacterium]|nr:hypothetical protein [Deltaproteobacteria bacterium]